MHTMHEFHASHAKFYKNMVCISKSGNQWEPPQRNPRKIRVCRVPTHKMQKWEQEGVGTVELDLKKLNQDIATLRKNRENVPLELLKTKYKKPYAKLKEEIPCTI